MQQCIRFEKLLFRIYAPGSLAYYSEANGLENEANTKEEEKDPLTTFNITYIPTPWT